MRVNSITLFQDLLCVNLIHKGNPVTDEAHKASRDKVHVGELDQIEGSGLLLCKGRAEEHRETEEVKCEAIMWSRSST